jgi:hypothetical protein
MEGPHINPMDEPIETNLKTSSSSNSYVKKNKNTSISDNQKSYEYLKDNMQKSYFLWKRGDNIDLPSFEEEFKLYLEQKKKNYDRLSKFIKVLKKKTIVFPNLLKRKIFIIQENMVKLSKEEKNNFWRLYQNDFTLLNYCLFFFLIVKPLNESR